MGVDFEEDLKRKLIDLNLIAGRKAQSPQTGYVHLNYESETVHDTIPIFENFCFILSLFRSRLIDNIAEGKALLEKLLIFEVEGNFPVYLHEYPQCKDRDFSLEVLPVFHWLITDFAAALGDQISNRLEMLIGRILSHNYKMHSQRPLSKSSEFRLKSYFEPAPFSWIPSTPEEWADLVISSQMAPNADLGLSLKLALEKWHPKLSAYMGPQYQDKGTPKVTLLDLIMGHYYGAYSERALQDRRTHLLACLIQPFGEEILLQSEMESSFVTTSPQQPYTLYWGTPSELNSLFFDAKQSPCSVEENEITITLPSETQESGQEAIEMSFFVNLSAFPEILIQGAKATTFQLGDAIDLKSDDLHLLLEVQIEKGEGRFFGHILRANRPTQKGKNLKYETYDWQIALRTIRRSQECTLKIKLEKLALPDCQELLPSHSSHCPHTE